MNKEAYMKQVMRHLNCQKNKKREIKKELDADIEAALFNKESWEDIQKRLGSPEQLANEFNENLGFVKKKRHFVVIGVIIVIVGLLIGGYFYIRSLIPVTNELGTSGLYEQSVLEEKASQVIELLNAKDFVQLQNLSDSLLAKEISEQKMNAAIEQLGELGDYQKITNRLFVEVTQKDATIAVGEMTALYAQRTVTYTISFNQDMQLVGLYMK